MSFQEFIDDKPTIANVEYETENKVVRFFHKDTNKTHFDKFRGVRKNGTLTKQYEYEQLCQDIKLQNLYLLLQQGRNKRIPNLSLYTVEPVPTFVAHTITALVTSK